MNNKFYEIICEFWKVIKLPSSTPEEITAQESAINSMSHRYEEPYRTMVLEWCISYWKCQDRLEAKDGI